MKPPICFPVLVFLAISTINAQQTPEEFPSKAELRRQLVSIDLEHATSMGDYLQRISEVAEIMPKIDKAYQIADSHLAEARKKYRNKPKMLRLVVAYEKLNELDREGLILLKEEIKRATWLAKLPPGNQQGYFDDQILPLRAKMAELATKEVEFARQMQKDGLALPADVAESIK